jgi:hypothetical protein
LYQGAILIDLAELEQDVTVFSASTIEWDEPVSCSSSFSARPAA